MPSQVWLGPLALNLFDLKAFGERLAAIRQCRSDQWRSNGSPPPAKAPKSTSASHSRIASMPSAPRRSFAWHEPERKRSPHVSGRLSATMPPARQQSHPCQCPISDSEVPSGSQAGDRGRGKSMRSALIPALVSVLLIAGCADAPGTHAVVERAGSDLLKLRAGPGLGYRIILGLPDGTALTRHHCVTEVGQRWCRVSLRDAPGVTGYVSADYLSGL